MRGVGGGIVGAPVPEVAAARVLLDDGHHARDRAADGHDAAVLVVVALHEALDFLPGGRGHRVGEHLSELFDVELAAAVEVVPLEARAEAFSEHGGRVHGHLGGEAEHPLLLEAVRGAL